MDCLVVGPGLGDKADDFILAAWNSDIPMVLDADGLRWLGRVKPSNRRQKWIGTPHPGEAKFLLNNEIGNRFTAVKRLKSKFGGEWVLKGPGTLVTYENSIYVNPFADGILATAGSGDILAGIIGGLIAQKMPQAALVGVWLHSESARLLLKDGEVRILASGLLDKFSEAIVRLEYC